MSSGDRIMLGHTTIQVMSIAGSLFRRERTPDSSSRASTDEAAGSQSDDEATQLVAHPFTKLLAFGDTVGGAFSTHSLGRASLMSDEELSEVGRLLLRRL